MRPTSVVWRWCSRGCATSATELENGRCPLLVFVASCHLVSLSLAAFRASSTGLRAQTNKMPMLTASAKVQTMLRQLAWSAMYSSM